MDYSGRIERGESPVLERWRLDPHQQLEDALFTGLRLTAGPDLPAIEARYGVNVWDEYGGELARFVEAGLLVYEPAGPRLALTRPGMLLANEVMAVFIGSPVR
jgi:coproporphyrinogen III oxidase-like Fe-S oxidoreductase